MQRSHRRSTKVCTRCRQRKTKCDFKFPACTACKLADAPCLGFDPSTRTAVPRSLVRSLEARVADLETQLAAHQAHAGARSISYGIASKIAQATISFGKPRLGSYPHFMVSSNLFFRPSCPPLAVVRARGRGEEEVLGGFANGTTEPPAPATMSARKSVEKQQQLSGNLINLNSIPSAAILRMLRNYADIHLPQYPCITTTTLDRIVSRVQDGDLDDTNSLLVYGIPAESALGHFEYFVLFIVLAISAMTLAWKAEGQALAASESFYNSALKHLKALGDHGEISGLQISLLLAHYAHMCPQRVDNWACISNAVRIVLSLGLHKECPESLDFEERRVRSELFWVTYGMERSLTSNLRLPLSFPEEVITTKLDLLGGEVDDSIFASEDMRKKASAQYIYVYRSFETEVHRVLHLQDDAILERTGATVESWIGDITRRLRAWYEDVKVYTQYGMLEFKHVQFNHLRARIHRPTPRLTTRTDADRHIVLESALALIDDYIAQDSRQRLFYPWHGVHILFETAVIAMDACWASRGYGPLQSGIQEMLDVHLPRCLQLLANIGRRWDEATVCAEKLDPLLQKLKAVAFATGNACPAGEEAAITLEIQGLLFSDGSLTWSNNPLWVEQSFLDDLRFPDENMFDNTLDFLQWGADWDIVVPTDMT